MKLHGGGLLPCLNNVLNVKALIGTFNQEGLLCDCEIFANLRLTFVSSSSLRSLIGSGEPAPRKSLVSMFHDERPSGPFFLV